MARIYQINCGTAYKTVIFIRRKTVKTNAVSDERKSIELKYFLSNLGAKCPHGYIYHLLNTTSIKHWGDSVLITNCRRM
jgi:hypothetical protein